MPCNTQKALAQQPAKPTGQASVQRGLELPAPAHLGCPRQKGMAAHGLEPRLHTELSRAVQLLLPWP